MVGVSTHCGNGQRSTNIGTSIPLIDSGVDSAVDEVDECVNRCGDCIDSADDEDDEFDIRCGEHILLLMLKRESAILFCDNCTSATVCVKLAIFCKIVC